jgi:hypothetical protein
MGARRDILRTPRANFVLMISRTAALRRVIRIDHPRAH